MALPYRWYPSGTHHTSEPKPGMLWPYEHDVWRIIAVNPVPEVDWTDREREITGGYRPEYRLRLAPRMVVVRPARINSGDVRDRDHDLHFRFSGHMSLDVYIDSHYPICAECHEPLPCRSQMAERVSAAAISRMARYEVAGVCPACGEVVTARQESHTWPDNSEVIGGPPVTFHLRRRCKHAAADYERAWVASDPERRRALLSCKGHVTNHNDGTYQCSELTECPGPRARHVSYTVCRCPSCHGAGRFGCVPSPNARNAALDADR